MPRLLPSLLVLLLTTSLAVAETFQAAPGDDLRAAIGRLQPGDTLLLAGGTYPDILVDGFAGGTSWENAITIKAAPGATVIFQPPAPQSCAYCNFILTLTRPEAQYIIFENLIFDGNNKTLGTITVTGNPSGNGPIGAHHIRFVNCEFRASYASTYVSHAHHVEFLGGSLHDNGTDYGDGLIAHGLYFASEASDNVVDGMQIYNNTHYGIHNYAESLESNRNIFRNNRIYNNGVLSGSGCGILYTGGQDGLIHHNLVYGNPGGGICVGHAGPSATITVVHNTIVGNTSKDGFAGLYMASGEGHVARNNITWNNGIDLVSRGGTTEDHNLSGMNPLFVGDTDFRLQTEPTKSPAIDTGTDVGFPYAGALPDIGACEVGLTATCGVTSSLPTAAPAKPTPRNLRAVRRR